MNIQGRLLYAASAGTSILVDLRDSGLPKIIHWGADLGPVTDSDLTALAITSVPPVVSNLIDGPVSVSILPEPHTGWMGSPGLRGSHDGQGWSTRFQLSEAHLDSSAEQHSGSTVGSETPSLIIDGSFTLRLTAIDHQAQLRLELGLELTPSGLIRSGATIHNTGSGQYRLEGLDIAFPVPARAVDVFDLAGRWSRERQPQRRAFTVGTHLRANHRGRTGADAATVLTVGTRGFDFSEGEVWGVHVGFSGNHRHFADHTSDGQRIIGGGELLLAGEIVLEPGDSYSSPTVFAGWARGLDALAHRFHDYLRSRPGHPRSPRPVTLNVWEAVYFNHSLEKLTDLARRAADLGVERYVLDDGWFRHRRNDEAGLGDWYVDEDVWPQGLHPLVNEVRSLGMTFGLWFEPEMINQDSDLAKRHPDWIMAASGRLPPLSRHQQVLDLTNPDAYAYIKERLFALITEYRLDYIKWDHNRDLIEAGRGATGAPGVHLQTLAVYQLLDELRSDFPDLDIESCSSGGARVDLGILDRTDRVWASDCTDPLERQQIQRWTSQLLPLELIGSHVASEQSHLTGRKHQLAFRCQTAMFSDFGIEWDLSEVTDDLRNELRSWVALYKRFRRLIHTGMLVRDGDPEGARWVTGVVSRDGKEALFSVAVLARTADDPPGRLVLRGLDRQRRYAVHPLEVPASSRPAESPPWWPDEVAGLAAPVMSGAMLGDVGVQLPSFEPGTGVVLHLVEV